MCIVSIPAMTIRALQKDLNPSIVDGDLFGQVMPVDGALQKSAGSSHVLLGSEKKINCIACP